MVQRHLWGIIRGTLLPPTLGSLAGGFGGLISALDAHLLRGEMPVADGMRKRIQALSQQAAEENTFSGAAARPGSRIVPVLLVSATMLRRDLIWRLYRAT